MTELTAKRTLVKSPPELWAECSDAAALARHLGSFGEIRITRLEPETAVAWEGDSASGTVRLEPSGWGTRVVLTARLATAPPAVDEPETESTPVSEEPVAIEEPVPGVDEVPMAGVEEEPMAEVEEEPVVAAVDEAAVDAPPVAPRGILARLRAALQRRRPAPPVPEPGLEPAPAEDPEPPRDSELLERRRPAPPVPEPGLEPAPAEDPEPPRDSELLEDPEPAEEPAVAATSVLEEEPAPADAASDAPPGPEALLTAALDSLGQAHHRPFSRA